MTELQASRTLVKSPPELWAECSDAASLARHLGQFGAIRITRLEPETAVAWEGERARGTVRIEPAGWGTKVILTAKEVAVEADQATTPALPPPVELGVEQAVAPRAVEPAVPPAVEVAVQPQEEADREPAYEMPAGGSAAPRRRRFARLLAFLRGQESSAEASGLAEGVTLPAAYAAGSPEVVAVDPSEVVAVDSSEVVGVDPCEVVGVDPCGWRG